MNSVGVLLAAAGALARPPAHFHPLLCLFPEHCGTVLEVKRQASLRELPPGGAGRPQTRGRGPSQAKFPPVVPAWSLDANLEEKHRSGFPNHLLAVPISHQSESAATKLWVQVSSVDALFPPSEEHPREPHSHLVGLGARWSRGTPFDLVPGPSPHSPPTGKDQEGETRFSAWVHLQFHRTPLAAATHR